jgi:hypothetical protein
MTPLAPLAIGTIAMGALKGGALGLGGGAIASLFQGNSQQYNQVYNPALCGYPGGMTQNYGGAQMPQQIVAGPCGCSQTGGFGKAMAAMFGVSMLSNMFMRPMYGYGMPFGYGGGWLGGLGMGGLGMLGMGGLGMFGMGGFNMWGNSMDPFGMFNRWWF